MRETDANTQDGRELRADAAGRDATAQRRRLRGPALAALTFVAFLVAADLAITAFGIRDGRVLGHFVPPSIPPDPALVDAYVAEQRALLAAGDAQRRFVGFDAELGWTVNPGAQDAQGRTYSNTLGARGTREYAQRPPEDALRVAAFGESFTWCAEVPQEDSWPAQIEALAPTCEVLNFGVNGYGTDQALLRFRRVARELGARVIAVGVLLENIGRNVTRNGLRWQRRSPLPLPKPRFVIEDGELVLVPLPLHSESEQLDAMHDGSLDRLLAEHEYWREPDLPSWMWSSSLVRVGAAVADSSRRRLENQWRDREGEPYRVLLALLEAFQREAVAGGADTALVLVFPLEAELADFVRDDDPFWSELLRDLDRRGIPYVDLCGPLRDRLVEIRRDGGAPLYRRKHLSRAGNEVVAREVLAWLAERYPGFPALSEALR